jgi:hypothetical protein
VTLTSTPPAALAKDTVDVGFHVNDAKAKAHCALDGGTAKDCDKSVHYDKLADGAHTISVYAVDTEGNRGATVSTSVVIAAGKPTVTSSPGSTVLLGLGSATFVWNAVPGLSYEYSFNGGGWKATSSSNRQTVSVGLLGSYTFKLHAVDSQGNHSKDYTLTFTVVL